MHRRLIAGALAAACALAVAACGVKFDGAPTGAQRDVIGDVVITTKICTVTESNCGPLGFDDVGQSILAYRVPAAAKAPVLTAASGLAYHRNGVIEQWLEDNDHADGTRWYAFISDARAVKSDETKRETVDAVFPLPAGSPYRGPFAYKTVTGARELGSLDQGDVTVRCANNQASLRGVEQEPEVPAADCVIDQATGSIDTRDLALSATAASSRAHLRATSVQQGTSGDVPFTATFAGTTTPDANFAMSATAPGLGAATVSPDHLVPGTDSATPLTVHVDVPAGAAPGDYPVTLTARLANGQSRTATGTITVTPAPGPAPQSGTTTSQGVTFSAPSGKTCLSRRVFTIMLLYHGRNLTSGTVTLNGKRIAIRRANKHMTARVDLRGLAAGTVSVRIVARTADGHTVRFTRRYKTCSNTPGDNELPKKDAI